MLKSEVHFPNLSFNSTEIDFGCILNDTEVMRAGLMTNCSPLPVKYSWFFIMRPPVVRENPELWDEGVDMESEYESDEVVCIEEVGSEEEEEGEGEEGVVAAEAKEHFTEPSTSRKDLCTSSTSAGLPEESRDTEGTGSGSCLPGDGGGAGGGGEGGEEMGLKMPCVRVNIDSGTTTGGTPTCDAHEESDPLPDEEDLAVVSDSHELEDDEEEEEGKGEEQGAGLGEDDGDKEAGDESGKSSRSEVDSQAASTPSASDEPPAPPPPPSHPRLKLVKKRRKRFKQAWRRAIDPFKPIPISQVPLKTYHRMLHHDMNDLL